MEENIVAEQSIIGGKAIELQTQDDTVIGLEQCHSDVAKTAVHAEDEAAQSSITPDDAASSTLATDSSAADAASELAAAVQTILLPSTHEVSNYIYLFNIL